MFPFADNICWSSTEYRNFHKNTFGDDRIFNKNIRIRNSCKSVGTSNRIIFLFADNICWSSTEYRHSHENTFGSDRIFSKNIGIRNSWKSVDTSNDIIFLFANNIRFRQNITIHNCSSMVKKGNRIEPLWVVSEIRILIISPLMVKVFLW